MARRNKITIATLLAMVTTSALLMSCQPQGKSETSQNEDLCNTPGSGVNWAALLTENCTNLSAYNLFLDPANPTQNPNDGGLPYDLSVELFTDYASKYRFAFVPENAAVGYQEFEVLDFPVGTVLVKTFALPEDTAFRGENERLIETRLLIHREEGWVARPYVWNEHQEAELKVAGATLEDVSLTHNGSLKTFDYDVPKATSCTSCHSVVPDLQGADDYRKPIFKPIGPKARYLNSDFNYQGIIQNQLSHWEDSGVLTGLPADALSIPKALPFTDTTSPSTLPVDDMNNMARAYLDINCAHCHRSDLTLPEQNYAGIAGASGLRLEFNRDYATDALSFGVCKDPVASGHEDYSADVVPQDPDDSYLLFRMNTNDQRHRMPELGRSLIHEEGVVLIREWILNLPNASCSP